MLDLYDKENLVAYLSLAEFREELIIAKNNMVILEKQNKRFLESLYYFSSSYQRNNPHATVFDLRPRRNIQFLLPVFFTQMLKNISNIQSHITSKSFLEITNTIKDSTKFFIKSRDEQTRIKDNLDSYITLSDELLIDFFVPKDSLNTVTISK